MGCWLACTMAVPSAGSFLQDAGPCEYAITLNGYLLSCLTHHTAILQVPFQSFAMKPLAGAHVCITNFSSAERAAIQEQAEAAGANFSAELHKDRCTHLICKSATGAKYK
jgi:hypothetical protein